MAADPIGVNSWVGTFTNFVNLLDLSALAVPAVPSTGSQNGGDSEHSAAAADAGVMLIGPAFGDLVLRQIAEGWVPELRNTGRDPLWGAARVRLAVFGAHRRGQPLNGQLREAGARFAGMATTAPRYGMGVLDQVGTQVLKPAVWRSAGGLAMVCELWDLSPAAFAQIVCAVPAPLVIGQIEPSSGEWITGFTCTSEAREVTRELEAVTDWVEFLERSSLHRSPSRFTRDK